MVDYDAFDTISSELHDLDTEQSEARYDPRILSRELLGTVHHRSGGRALDETNDDEQSETATGGGAHCIVNAERRYEHGDKIQRNDPCEICLCVDGEVFCWWKKCVEHKKHAKKLSRYNGAARKGNGHRGKHHHHRQSKTSSKQYEQSRYRHDEVEMKSTPLYRRYQPLPLDSAVEQKKPQQESMTRVVTPTKNKLQKNVLNVPKQQQQQQKQHMPVHIMDLAINEMDANDDDDLGGDRIQTPTYTSTPQQTYRGVQQTASDTTTSSTSSSSSSSSPSSSFSSSLSSPSTSRLPTNVLNSNAPIIGDDSHNNLVLNDKVTSISVVEPNDTARKVFIGTSVGTSTSNNNITKPVILVDDKLLNTMDDAVGGSDRNGVNGQRSSVTDDDTNSEKGYFEKTIINKNGVFIENIRKITNIDQRILGTSDFTTTKQKPNGLSSPSGMDIDNYDGSDDMDSDNGDDISVNGASTPKLLSMDNLNGNINSKSIELMNNVPVAHAQHYVITSSGKIEKTDAMVSDDVIAQFQGGLTNTNNNNNNNNVVVNSNINAANNNNNNKLNVRQQQQQQQQQYTHQTIQPQSDGNFAASSATAPVLSPHIETFTGGNLLTTTNVGSSESSSCIVMGKTYSIGTVLPQEAGNCLQCICVNGINEGDPPKVTCSPHNCPPLILPDLFDSTGY